MDATSMFHDLVPGANTAASNIMAVLLAAEAIGGIKDEVLDGLYSRIGFGLFQGESYGYIGSRRFFKDVVGGFACDGGDEGVASVYKRKDEETTARACVKPMRADLTFQNLGAVRGMIAVDQVGNLGGGKNFYVQGGESTGEFAGFMAQVMVELFTEDYTVQASSVAQNAQEDGSYPLPPTPLISLMKVSDSYGGVVLTGYDDAFVADSHYHSHLDSTAKVQSIDPDALASAATGLARTAVAAAYQNEEVDAETAAAYAKNLIPNAVSSSSETFKTLYNCLFEDGNCEALLKFGSVEVNNDAVRTGYNSGMGQPLGTPPNYYVSIYNLENGQAAVRSSGKLYGSLDAGSDSDVKAYGQDTGDTFLLRGSLLEMGVFGMLNNFLGKGSFSNESSEPELTKCQSTTDCSSVSYCSTDSSSLNVATCAGGQCVCGSRSHYHPALDEALAPADNKYPNYFEIQEGDAGISALYTEVSRI
jgi:nicastrin